MNEREPVLDELVNRLVAYFCPRKIYLFGSRAQDHATAESDYDLLVVLENLEEPSYRYAQRAHEVLWGLRCSKDVFFTSLKRFDELKFSVGSLSELVHRKGKALYAA